MRINKKKKILKTFCGIRGGSIICATYAIVRSGMTRRETKSQLFMISSTCARLSRDVKIHDKMY